jgi:small subunit ribosomal protein S5
MKAVTKAEGKRAKIDFSEVAIEEKLISIDRVTKVVKGGRQLRFRALMVAGDGRGHVGFASAKARGVPDAIHKAAAVARKDMIEVIVENATIPHEILAKFGASRVLLKPAAPGTGIIASDSVRAVLEAAGIKNIVSKSLGSSNRGNTVKATVIALSNLRQRKRHAVVIDKVAPEKETEEELSSEAE